MVVAVRKPKTSYSQPTLRLVRDDEPAAAVGTRERRVFARREVSVTVMGHRLDHSIVARRQPALALTVRDVSVGGLSALTETPLLPGERIAVSFPAEGLRMGWGASGRVVRCEPAALGYRVAVEFESTPTAA